MILSTESVKHLCAYCSLYYGGNISQLEYQIEMAKDELERLNEVLKTWKYLQEHVEEAIENVKLKPKDGNGI